METAVVRIFDAFERAQRARDALLAEGFDAGDILFSVANDEAGPVHANFAIGNTPGENEGHMNGGDDARPAQGAHCIVAVAATDGQLAARADAILARYGARALNDLARRVGGS